VIRLQQLRLDSLLSVEDLARKAGVSGGAIRRLEAEKGIAQIGTLEKLSKHFGVRPSELLLPVTEKEAA
jgi:transcriptional regulator with XRE-family HTH domain